MTFQSLQIKVDNFLKNQYDYLNKYTNITMNYLYIKP